MKIYAINGSPRKNGSTAALCAEFLNGAAEGSARVQTELIHLSDLRFSGCISCYACKRMGADYGKCAVKDELHPLLSELSAADGLAFGSPIYLGGITGVMHSFLERLLFPFCTFEHDYKTIAPKHLPVVMIYTMMAAEQAMYNYGYTAALASVESNIGYVFSVPEVLYAHNSLPLKDFSGYKIDLFSDGDKRRYLEVQFPDDCRKAYEAGRRMAALV